MDFLSTAPRDGMDDGMDSRKLRLTEPIDMLATPALRYGLQIRL
jgi:hypothetical protein|uniref:Uncharacterized protein n=1 Tax=Picea sitchensis TaxID=3332 RepID=A0A6B9XSR9_PICSI|nr:hypothetical protein Q903MT_gene4056 [Picea sitchensis]